MGVKSREPCPQHYPFRNNRAFAFSNVAALINYSATFAVGFLLSLYFQIIRGLDVVPAGTILVSQPIIQAIFSPLASKLSDMIEPRIVASIGMGLTSAGLVLFTLVTATTPLAYIIITLALLGFGFALFSSPNTNAVMGSVENRFYGVASVTVSTMRLIGQVLSLGIVLIVFALYIGRVAIAPAYYPQLLTTVHLAFVIFAFSALRAYLPRSLEVRCSNDVAYTRGDRVRSTASKACITWQRESRAIDELSHTSTIRLMC